MRTNLSLDLDEVVSIEEMGYLPTWDFEIPDTHCYFANGVLVHNSLENDSDVVMILHRDDYYREQQEESPALDGLAQCYVLKNRQGRKGIAKLAWLPEYCSFADCVEETIPF